MPKPLTSYTPSISDSTASKWTLNSTLITLNSATAFLSGYFTAAVPNQLNNKPLTAYTAA